MMFTYLFGQTRKKLAKRRRSVPVRLASGVLTYMFHGLGMFCYELPLGLLGTRWRIQSNIGCVCMCVHQQESEYVRHFAESRKSINTFLLGLPNGS